MLSDIVLLAVNALKTSFRGGGGQPSFTGSVADCISEWAECQLKWERWQSLFMCVAEGVCACACVSMCVRLGEWACIHKCCLPMNAKKNENT